MINAYTWYNIAVAKGIKSAKAKRDEILNDLNEKDLLEAQSLSFKPVSYTHLTLPTIYSV